MQSQHDGHTGIEYHDIPALEFRRHIDLGYYYCFLFPLVRSIFSV
ncbi:MAG: hypothetical protein Q4P66_00615 [Actinomycetaceae bacterium]|nr:hypothetical protein [Actinomycetaceae bacterium]